jgi:hypothetical protein
LSAEHAQTLRLLREEVTWEESGLKQHMKVGEAVQRALIGQAMAGDVRAIKLVREQEARARAEEARLLEIAGRTKSAELVKSIREALNVSARLQGGTLPPDIHNQVYGVPPARDDEDGAGEPAPIADDARAAGEARSDCADDDPVCSAEDWREQEASQAKAAEGERLAPRLGRTPGHVNAPSGPSHAAGCGGAPDTAECGAERHAKAEAEDPARREPWDAHLSAPPPSILFENAPTGPFLPSISSTPRRLAHSSGPLIKDTRPMTRRY